MKADSSLGEKQHTKVGSFIPRKDLVGSSDDFIFSEYIKCLNTYPITKLLRDANIVLTGRCNRENDKITIDDIGFKEHDKGRVLVSAQGVCHYLSLALYLNYKKKLTADSIKYLRRHTILNTKEECLPSVINSCLVFNSTKLPDIPETDPYLKLIKMKMPLLSAQEKFLLPQRNYLARCGSWFGTIPKLGGKYEMPADVVQAFLDLYDIDPQYLAGTALMLYAAGLSYFSIDEETFRLMKDKNRNPAFKFLKKIALPISEFSNICVEQDLGLNPPIMHQMPYLIKYPIVQVADDLWSIPMPKLILNKLVDGICWGLFDYFNPRKKGAGDKACNIYSDWFGHVFEKYISEAMLGSFTRKLQEESLCANGDKTPDLIEIHHNRALLIEVKARRPLLKTKIGYSEDYFNKIKEFAEEVVDQVLSFIKRHCLDSVIDFPKFDTVKKYIVLIVTPEQWMVNSMIDDKNIFDEKINEIIKNKPHIHSIKIVFADASDIETIPALKGHEYAYDYIDSYLDSTYYPNVSMGDYIKKITSSEKMRQGNPFVQSQMRLSLEIGKDLLRGVGDIS